LFTSNNKYKMMKFHQAALQHRSSSMPKLVPLNK